MRTKTNHSFKILSGAEIETLADYKGQGALGVKYTDEGRIQNFHPLPKAYDNTIAQSVNASSSFCMSTDSNRSEERVNFPMRTCMEFRAGPEWQETEQLLSVIKAYSDWHETTRAHLRETQYKDYSQPKRSEIKAHDVRLNEFIQYYNGLATTDEKLRLTLPSIEFNASHSGPEFRYNFSTDAEWVIRFEHDDLDAQHRPVFFAQYNLSIPIGYVFDPATRKAFGLQKKFFLLDQEKEIAPDFNESRPHGELRAYENKIFTAAVQLADEFSAKIEAPSYATGMRDFLRGIAYEFALFATSETQLFKQFRKEALAIWNDQHGKTSRQPSDQELDRITENLAYTLRKSLFPYFMKATLSQFFKNLHPYEQHFLRQIPKGKIKSFFHTALKLANNGRAQREPSYFILDEKSLLDRFDDFYEETFLGAEIAGDSPTDPMGSLTEGLVEPLDISQTDSAIPAVVLEVRQPQQGNQQYAAMVALCNTYNAKHRTLLQRVVPLLTASRQQLDEQWLLVQKNNPKKASSSTASILSNLRQSPQETVQIKNSTTLQKPATRKRQRDEPLVSTQIYTKSDLWATPKSYRVEKPVSTRTRQRR